MKFRIILFLSLTLFLAQCKNDFEVNDDWKDITVVYGLLNSADSIQYVRVTKAFLGSEDAYVMAQQSDSLYYKNIEVKLEEYSNAILTNTFDLEKDSLIPRDSGVFASDKNIYYKTSQPLNPTARYKLKILENGKEISSETSLIQDFYVSEPPPQISLSSNGGFLEIKWTTPVNARIFEVTLWFSYYEVAVNGTDTVITKDSIDVSFPRKISSRISGGENMSAILTGALFISTVESKIQQKPDVIKRVVAKNCFGFSFLVGSDDLYTYMQVNAPSSGIVTEKPVYTNITNGIGLFTSRFYKKLAHKKLPAQQTVDAIYQMSQTENLHFVDYNTTWHLWTGTGFNYP
jgi:hypothetical protein